MRVNYSPDKGLIALALGPAIILILGLAAELTHGVFQWDVLIECLTYAAVVLVIFERFRVTFDKNELIYRRWGSTVHVLYSEMESITVVNNSRGKPVRAIIHTRQGAALPFWWKLFPDEAATRFFALAKLNGAERKTA